MATALPTPIGRFERPRPLQITVARGGTTNLTPLRFPVYTSGGRREEGGSWFAVATANWEDWG